MDKASEKSSSKRKLINSAASAFYSKVPGQSARTIRMHFDTKCE